MKFSLNLPALTLLWVFLWSSPVFSKKWDASGNLQAFYPLGAVTNWWFGYNALLWGEFDKNNESLKGWDRINYGYIRPHAKLAAAGVYNGVDLRLSIAPISFVKTLLGANWNYLSVKPGGSSYDCTEVRCLGLHRSLYLEQFFKWKIGYIFGSLKGRLDHLYSPNDLSFMNPEFQIPVYGKSENVLSLDIDFATKLAELWVLASSFERSYFMREQLNKDTYEISVLYQTDRELKWSYSVALSKIIYPSSVDEYGVGFRVDWKWSESYQL